jgi:hypothetical protein
LGSIPPSITAFNFCVIKPRFVIGANTRARMPTSVSAVTEKQYTEGDVPTSLDGTDKGKVMEVSFLCE